MTDPASQLAFFHHDEATDSFIPAPFTISPWSRSQVGGFAVCGLLARAIEAVADVDELVPTRLTVDLTAPVDAAGVATSATVLRRGSRVQLVDATAGRDGVATAWARAVFAVPGEAPSGSVWSPASTLPTPPDVGDDPAPPLILGDDGEWSGDFAAHRTPARKAIWQQLPPLVAGEALSPFVHAAVMADSTSLVCHWGSAGTEFINVDVTLALVRPPEGSGLGLLAEDRRTRAGISVGTATMFDRRGAVGTCTVSAIANSRTAVTINGG